MLEVLEIDRHLLTLLRSTSWPDFKTFKESEQSLRVVWHAGKKILFSLMCKNFDLCSFWSEGVGEGGQGLVLGYSPTQR